MTRLVISWGFLLAATAGLRLASADTICLKNGDRIQAERVSQDAKSVHYEIGDNAYTIPNSLVARIEHTADDRVANTEPADLRRLPTPAPYSPVIPTDGEAELFRRLVDGGRIDREALSAIEAQKNPREASVAFYVAGREEFEAGDYPQARRDFERALYYDGENPAILSFYAALLVRTGEGREAMYYAQRAVDLAADSADAWAVLGYTQFAADRLEEAAASWRKSLLLRPDKSIAQLLDRAQRESAAESHYRERESSHFVLRYEGGQSSEALRGEILSTLEAAYRELALAFQSEPRASLEVVLYTSQTFFDVTRAPAWIGALNDGKIRIPLRGLDAVTPDLARILKHELAHSFIYQLSMGRCPAWLNEGLAQTLEPRSLAASGRALAALYRQGHEIPLNALDQGCSSLSAPEARLAYDESLATVQYIQSQYGMSELVRLLNKLGHGESLESALGSTIHSNYGQLEQETGAHLLQQFGG